MTYRHEWKHEINLSDIITLRQRLQTVAKTDTHVMNGTYTVRSLYFDSLSDKALREKLDGVNRREKFRIRYYNGNTSLIHLEKKSKLGGLGTKQNAVLTKEEAQTIIDSDYTWMAHASDSLIRELHYKMTTQQLRPKTIRRLHKRTLHISRGQCQNYAGLQHSHRSFMYRLFES